MKIAVAGTGYVGISMATLLAQRHTVTAVDIVPEKVEMINSRQSPIQDEYIEKYFAEKNLDLVATLDGEAAYRDAEFVIIAAPTNYDPQRNFFDTSAVEAVIDKVLSVNPDAVMVIKSTIPVGYCDSLYARYGSQLRLLFSPEFLRESKALYDNLYPSRIIVGSPECEQMKDAARTFASLLKGAALKEDVSALFMGLKEAEAVKLFANTYLALRVSYFNELDTYAEVKGLDTRQIIEGVCLDPRTDMVAIAFRRIQSSFLQTITMSLRILCVRLSKAIVHVRILWLTACWRLPVTMARMLHTMQLRRETARLECIVSQ